MNIMNFFLEILIVFSIFACLTVITSTNPVIAIIYLIGVFLSAAIYLIFVGLNFIGISYIIVYIGAITVLFLFVIMLLNIDLLDILETGKKYTQSLPLILTLFGLFVYGIFSVLPLNNFKFYPTTLETLINLNFILGDLNKFSIDTIILPNNSVNTENLLTNVLQIESLGISLYTNFAIPLIILSIVLLLSMVAVIVLLINEISRTARTENK
jgi:NADH-ubiquinone oxidoreductase chain 6